LSLQLELAMTTNGVGHDRICEWGTSMGPGESLAQCTEALPVGAKVTRRIVQRTLQVLLFR